MGYVVRLEDFKPGQRDDTPWTQVRIEEAESQDGPFTAIDTQDLDPVDTNPAEPAARDITTTEATEPQGWFKVVFLDDDGNLQEAEPVFFPHPGARPSLEDVGALIRARTKDNAGGELGTFDENTRPTSDEVRRLIRSAASDLAVRVGATIPDELLESARHIVALRAAQLVELSYFPEQAADRLMAYQSLRLSYEEAASRLVTAVQLRCLFTESEESAA